MPKRAEHSVFRRPRSKFWQIRWTGPDGVEIRRSSGTEDYEEASRQLASIKAGSGLIVEDLIVRFFEQHQMKPKTALCYKTSSRAWYPIIGRLLVEQIDRTHIQRFVSVRLREVKHGTIRGDLAFLSSLLTFAGQLPGGPAINIVKSFNKRHLKRPEERVRWLTDNEVARLLDAIASPKHRLIVLFGLEAGLRQQEILRLKLKNLDLEKRRIYLRGKQTKSSRGRVVPISGVLFTALSAHLAAHKIRDDEAWVFVNDKRKKPYYGVRPWWDNAVAEAKIEDFHFHDTRHHFASRFVQAGGRLQPLMELMGHSSMQVTMRYAHLAPGDSEAEFVRLSKGKRRLVTHTYSRATHNYSLPKPEKSG